MATARPQFGPLRVAVPDQRLAFETASDRDELTPTLVAVLSSGVILTLKIRSFEHLAAVPGNATVSRDCRPTLTKPCDLFELPAVVPDWRKVMRGKGINYDTGFCPAGRNTRPVFDADVVKRDMLAIVDDLHCNAVRISGADPERLTVAAEQAAAAGLDVWYAPVPSAMATADMRPLFDDCADRAEAVRKRSTHEVVLVLGCEMSVFAEGFVPGEDVYQRLASLSNPTPEMYASYAAFLERLNAFVGEAAGAARRRFGGRLTYASGLWEQIDWRPFDLVGVDAYRDASNATTYNNQLRNYFAHGKPVAITEFGCCTYRGAADRGGHGWAIGDDKVSYDEFEQVAYLRELVEIFETQGVDSAFWFSFAAYHLPRHLDSASYGVVRILDDGTGRLWEPKHVFHALAATYGG